MTAGVRYAYAFEIDDDQVRGAWLHAYPKGREQVWFDRDDDALVRGLWRTALAIQRNRAQRH